MNHPVGWGISPTSRWRMACVLGLSVSSFLVFAALLVGVILGVPSLLARQSATLETVYLVACLLSIAIGLPSLLDMSGMRARNLLRVTPGGLRFHSQSGREQVLSWDRIPGTLIVRDFRERPPGYGPPNGIYLSIVGYSKSAWIDQPTLYELVSIANSQGWIVRQSSITRTTAGKGWRELKVTVSRSSSPFPV